MATAVLSPRDCLTLTQAGRRNPNRATVTTGSGRRKRSPLGNESDRQPMVVKSPSTKMNNLVMGQVKILKRGDPIDDNFTKQDKKKVEKPIDSNFAKEKTKQDKKKVEKPIDNNFAKEMKKKVEKIEDSSDVFSKDRLGPEPEMIPKEIRLKESFAGLSCDVASPSPSSLPYPTNFFTKKCVVSSTVDTATMDILRLLRIDLVG